MNTYQLIAGSVLTCVLTGTLSGQDLVCGRVHIDSIERTTDAAGVSLQHDSKTDEGDWDSLSEALGPFGSKIGRAEQTGFVHSDEVLLELYTNLNNAQSPAFSNSRVVVKFHVSEGPDWWEECSTLEGSTDPVSPIAKDYTRIELDLNSDFWAQSGGTPSNPGALGTVSMELIHNGVHLAEEHLDGGFGERYYSGFDKSYSLEPGNYTLIVDSSSTWSPPMRQGRNSSVIWEGNSGKTYCLNKLELNFREALDPGKAFVEVLYADRVAQAHVEGHVGHTSDGTTGASYPCAGSLYWDAGSGANFSEATQESQIRSSAFWGEFNVNAKSHTPGRESTSWTSMNVRFRTYDRTLAQIDIRSWALAFRFWEPSIAEYSLKARIVDVATGNVVSERLHGISSMGTPFFDTDMDIWNVVLDPDREYRFYVKVKAEAENTFWWPASTMILGTGNVKIAFQPLI